MISPAKYDSGDLDAILELLASPGYDLVVKRIRSEIERRRDELERDGDPQRLRGMIAAFRITLEIAANLKREIQENLA